MTRARSSVEPVTVAFLVERQVALDWQEAVAVVLELAEVFERSGKRKVPRHDSVALTPSGRVEFLRGRTQSGDTVSTLARMLNELLPQDRPTQLRLLASTAGQGSAAYKSVGDFIEALRYFERPGRQNLLSTVYQRALDTPVRLPSREDETPSHVPSKKARPRRVLVPLAVSVLVATSVAVLVYRQPGPVSGQAASLRDLALDVWSTARESTSGLRESAARDLSTMLEQARKVAAEQSSDGTDTDSNAANDLDKTQSPTAVARRSGNASSVRPRVDATASASNGEPTVTLAEKGGGCPSSC